MNRRKTFQKMMRIMMTITEIREITQKTMIECMIERTSCYVEKPRDWS